MDRGGKMEKSEKFSMLKIVWKASAFRFVWMGILVVLSVVPKFVSVYGLKLITDYFCLLYTSDAADD